MLWMFEQVLQKCVSYVLTTEYLWRFLITFSNTIIHKLWMIVLEKCQMPPNEGEIFVRLVFHPSCGSSETWRINTKQHYCCSVGTCYPNTFVRCFMLDSQLTHVVYECIQTSILKYKLCQINTC